MRVCRGEMQTLCGRLRRHLLDLHLKDAAQDLIEYALIAAMFVLVCSVALTPVTQAVNNGISSVGKKFKEHVDQGLHKGWYK